MKLWCNVVCVCVVYESELQASDCDMHSNFVCG